MRILVADDDAELRELMVEFLTDEGHDITDVSTPHEALSLAQAQRWDLFLVDTLGQADHGPSGQCTGFVQALASHAPVILCTARSWARDLEPHAVGAVAIVCKPFDLDALIETVKTVGTAAAADRQLSVVPEQPEKGPCSPELTPETWGRCQRP